MNARYYGSNTNRWLSPDTIVPNPANPQSFNRYSYVSNNPVNFTDPSGHSECGVGQYHCAGDDYKPTVVILGGSYGDINRPGPTVRNQMPAWDSNPWGYDMVNIRYPGSKYEQFQAMIVQDIDEPQVIVGYSAGAEAALMYASSHPSVDTIILLGPTFTGGDVLEGDDIGFEGWSKYMEQVLANGTKFIIVDDDFTADRELNL